MADVDRCVCCGEPIPEGRMICPNCESGEKKEGQKMNDPVSVEMNIFDEEEIIENCTVQILRNSVTGEVSVGWWRNED